MRDEEARTEEARNKNTTERSQEVNQRKLKKQKGEESLEGGGKCC